MTRTAIPTPRPAADGKAKHLLDELSRPGPLPVLRGDLGMSGTAGVIYAPERGLGLPAVAFGHDWLQPATRYAWLLRHLASWGIVAAAPDGHRGPLPSHAGFAADLRTTLDVVAGVRLGEGLISVDSRRTALAGHGIGAGAAIVAASGQGRVAAVVTLAPAQTRPSAVDAARTITVPALHLAAGKDQMAPSAGHAEPIAEVWRGPAVLRTLPKASHTAFLEGRHWSDLLLPGDKDAKVRKVTRALVTAFLLHHLAGEDRVDALLTGKVSGTSVIIRN